MHSEPAKQNFSISYKKDLDKEQFDHTYTQAVDAFVSHYQQHDAAENNLNKINHFLGEISKTHDISGNFQNRFFDDVLRGMSRSTLKKKFIQEMFFLQFEGKPAELESRLATLYKPFTKYIAEAAAQLGAYSFVIEYVAGVFEEAKSNAGSRSPGHTAHTAEESNGPDKDYEDVSKEYKFSDPDIIAVELAYYVELLDTVSVRTISRQKQRTFLRGLADHLYEARTLLGILEGP